MNTHRNKTRGVAEVGGWLHLAASPSFAGMALVIAITGDDPASMLCQMTGHGPLSLGGMTVMYLLMAIFHVGPWWEWILLKTRGDTQTKQVRAPKPTAVESRRR